MIGPNPKLFPRRCSATLGERTGARGRCRPARSTRPNAPWRASRGPARRQTRAASRTGRAFAILYRANHQAKPFEQALRKANIPYKVSGGTELFDRAEIRDLCAWFRLWINNDDDPAFLRAITDPKRGIGHHAALATGRLWPANTNQPVCRAVLPMLGHPAPARPWAACTSSARYVNDLEYRARQTQGPRRPRAF